MHVGVSPRGALALRRAAQARALVDGRDFCIPEDVRELAVRRARATASWSTRAAPAQRGAEESEWLVREILEQVPVPL